MKLPVAMFQSWGSCAALVPSSTCGDHCSCQCRQCLPHGLNHVTLSVKVTCRSCVSIKPLHHNPI